MTSPLHCALTIPARGSQKCQDFSQLFFKAFYVMKSSHEWGFSHQHISCWGQRLTTTPLSRPGRLLNLKCEMLYGFYKLVKHLQFFTSMTNICSNYCASLKFERKSVLIEHVKKGYVYDCSIFIFDTLIEANHS